MRTEQGRHRCGAVIHFYPFSAWSQNHRMCLRVSQRWQQYQLHSWDMYRWHLLLSWGTQNKGQSKSIPSGFVSKLLWMDPKEPWWGVTAGRAGERRTGKEGILEAKHKVLERGIQPHLVLQGEALSCGVGTTSSGVKSLCLFVTVFGLDLGWYVLGSRNETLFCALRLSQE